MKDNGGFLEGLREFRKVQEGFERSRKVKEDLGRSWKNI